jgi:hypothetical protein
LPGLRWTEASVAVAFWVGRSWSLRRWVRPFVHDRRKHPQVLRQFSLSEAHSGLRAAHRLYGFHHRNNLHVMPVDRGLDVYVTANKSNRQNNGLEQVPECDGWVIS